MIKKGCALIRGISPADLLQLGMAYRVAGRYEEAIVTLKNAITRNPNSLSPHRLLAASYAELGRLEEARAEMAEVLRLNPNSLWRGEANTPLKIQRT